MKITATFMNGQTISRKTTMNLTHAYQVKNQWQTFTGFASSEELALKSAKEFTKYGTPEHIEIREITIL
jgi:hypothetical protein